MYTREEIESMRVIELRQVAKENGIPLSAGISKQGIIDKLCEKLLEKKEPEEVKEEAPATPQIIRRVASIISDDDDTPVMTPNTSFNRNQITPSSPVRPVQRAPETPAPAPTPSQPTINRGNIPGTNKPVFSLEGVRAWHNPRTYQQPQTGNTYGQRSVNSYTQQRQPQMPYGQQRVQTRPTTTVSRFGPEAVPNDMLPTEDAMPPQRPVSFGAPENQPVPAYQQPSYQAPGLQSQTLNYQSQQPAVPAAPAAPQPNLPELLAMGDIKDGSGVLDIHPDGYGFLRMRNLLPGGNDVYVSNAQIRRFHLKNGDYVTGKIRPQHENDRFGALLYITEINGQVPEELTERVNFENLTAVYPTKKIQLSKKAGGNLNLKLMDAMYPMGFGQRALIIAKPHGGKTALVTDIANAVQGAYPDTTILTFLVGDRPEDITLARAAMPGEIIAASFAEPTENQTRASEMLLERAMRLAEQKKDVVVIIDNLTSLCRAYNENAPQTARMLPCGLAAGALAKPRRLFGAARALQEGGSITMIAVVTAETESALDACIVDEFRGAANMTLYLNGDHQIDIRRSSTRKAELLQSATEKMMMDEFLKAAADAPETAMEKIKKAIMAEE